MKSPFAPNTEAILVQELDSLTYRGEQYSYISNYYKCPVTEETFTTTELDEINMEQIYSQYRSAHGIPYTEDIVKLRQLCNLSASKMSDLLGLGINQYRLYEAGEIPSVAIGKMISLLFDNLDNLIAFLNNNRETLKDNAYKVAIERINSEKQKRLNPLYSYIRFNKRCKQTGYSKVNAEKIENMIIYFISQFKELYPTQMNKMFFYSDFFQFKKTMKSITGLSYSALPFGIVPNDWKWIYSACQNVDMIEAKEFGMNLITNKSFDESIFSAVELNTLQVVAEHFKGKSASQISNENHQEDIYKNHQSNPAESISFEEAISLKFNSPKL